ncbi:MAG: 2-oxo acid dehydrogenase subunit E2 [Pirellulaceae bacterium]|nr:2-oxo acid dehydrogenase subunit E2 [Pirellulaceae bacterium]
MPHSITIPRLGWSMEEGVLAEWLKAPGEFVRVGDMLFLLEGDKVATEIESLDSGYLCVPTDAPRPGTTVKVGEVIGFLIADGELAPTSIRIQPTTPVPTATPREAALHLARTAPVPSVASASPTVHQAMPRAAGPAARRLARELGIDLNAVFTPDPTGRVLCEDVQRAANQRRKRGSSSVNASSKVSTPRARRRARELGIDWTSLDGTGRNGRIRERDVLAGAMAPAVKTAPSPIEIPPAEPGRHVPASKLRRILAQRLSAGVHQAVPVTLTTKINAISLVAHREQLKSESQTGVVPAYNDILIHLAAETLRELPDLNACWYREGIHAYEAINIATAVDTPNGLLAPVVRDADRLSLPEIADRTRQLLAAARSGRLSQNQLTGGTFTISNLGMFGIDAFTPVLNMPQAAILGVGRIIEEPIVRDGRLVAGKTISLSLTFDHRVVDGARAARWLQRFCERLQTTDC